MISLRQRTLEATGMSELSEGFWGSVVNAFYRESAEHRKVYPYLVEGSESAISIRKTLDGFRMPTAFNSASYYPDDQGGSWSEEFNGVTASDNTWYLTSNDLAFIPNTLPPVVILGVKLYYIPFTGDLNGSGNFVRMPDSLKNSYIHFGDPAYWKPTSSPREFVLVPCDHRNGFDIPDICVAYEVTNSSSPVYVGHQPVEVPGSQSQLSASAWCAVSPVRDIYYCSEFCDESGLVIYPFVPRLTSPGGEFDLEWIGLPSSQGLHIRRKDGTPETVYRVQGGAVSENGHLYVVSDVAKSAGGGLRLIEMASGTIQNLILNMGPGKQPSSNDCEFDGELEYQGVCIKNVNDVPHASSVSGQIHWGMLNNDVFSEDNVTMAHFTITDPNEEPWI